MVLLSFHSSTVLAAPDAVVTILLVVVNTPDALAPANPVSPLIVAAPVTANVLCNVAAP